MQANTYDCDKGGDCTAKYSGCHAATTIVADPSTCDPDTNKSAEMRYETRSDYRLIEARAYENEESKIAIWGYAFKFGSFVDSSAPTYEYTFGNCDSASLAATVSFDSEVTHVQYDDAHNGWADICFLEYNEADPSTPIAK